jgi:hypothetical protein
MIGTATATETYGLHTYGPSRSWAAGMYFLVAVSAIPGALGVWYFTAGAGVHQTKSPMVLVVISACFLALGLLLLASVRKAKVVLSSDSVTVYDLFSTKEIRRDEIKGYRIEQPAKGTPSTVLLPRFENRKAVKIPHIFDFDRTYHAWLAQFPDLGAEEAAEAQSEMEGNPVLGSTPAEREASLRQARSLGRWLNIGAGVMSAWGWFYPSPYRAVIGILCLMPWLALALAWRYRGLFRIDQKRNDPHPTIAYAFLFPGLVLSLRVIHDVYLVGWQRPLTIAIIVDGLLCFIASQVDPTLVKNRAAFLLLFIVSIAYGFGMSTEANALLDRSEPQVFQSHIVSKRISHGRSTSYHVTLDRWGPKTSPDEVMVTRGYYDSFAIGDRACVLSREGALKMQWYVVRHCR